MKLLIVGGTGYLGSVLRPALEVQHTCHYLAPEPVLGAEERTLVGALHDEAVLKKAVHGVDRLVWLGVDSGKGSNQEPATNVFGANIKSLYRLLHIAQFSGVLRFVYASSMSVYANCGARDGYPLHELMPADAWDSNGLCHRLGEAVGQACVRNRPECTFLSLRLMSPLHAPSSPDHEQSTDHRYYPLGSNDLCRLFLAAIAFDRLGYYLLQATGDLKGESFPNARATAVLGWQPQGD